MTNSPRLTVLLLLLVSVCVPATRAQSNVVPSVAAPGDFRYDVEYPFIGYSKIASDNAIASLQAKIDRREIRLDAREPRGYLDSLLRALGIDASSQVLVFSKSSLQIDHINAGAPRAIYFNDDTYVSWVQGGFMEIATVDGRLGPVFYTLENRTGASVQFDREMQRCLLCHDTFGLAGGGVPRFLFQSAYLLTENAVLTDVVASETTDTTPLEARWGGWYVTGHQGSLVHLGNIFREPSGAPVMLDKVARGNLATLSGLFDTTPYLTNKSDIVALLVMEHQVYIHDLISRANYKTRWLMARSGHDRPDTMASWAELSPQTRKLIEPMLEQLVRAMLFIDAAPVPSGIASTSGFGSWFQSRAPSDRHGRSLRALDLHTRLFRFPLSFLIYSLGFDGLPPGVKDFVYERFAEILSGRDQSAVFRQTPLDVKQDTLEILTETKPDFAHRQGRSPEASARQPVVDPAYKGHY